MNERTLKAAGYQCRTVINQATGVPIVLLHGLSYTIDVWQRLSITTLLTEKKLPFLALDMPYGKKSECKPKTNSPDANVTLVREAIENVFKSAVPILVGASLGGNIALRYAQKFPVKGLLLVSPAKALDEKLTESYDNWAFPVRIIWGSEDNIILGEEMRTLAQKLRNSKLVTYEGGGHSAYKNEPERFKRDLLELYATAEDTLKL